MPDLEELCRYAGATLDTDRWLLNTCMEAAQLWYENAGVSRREANALYDLGVYQLATHYYDNRGVIADVGNIEHVPLGVFSIMHQLRSAPGESEGA